MKTIITILLLLSYFIPASSQVMTMKQIETDLNHSYQDISGNGYPSQSDSIEVYDSLFREKMAYYTVHFPFTLKYPFDSLKQDLAITTAGDSLFRIYSWDRYDGGTMHDYDNLFQFSSGGKVYSKLSPDKETDDNYDPGVVYTVLYILKAGHKTYYMAFGNGAYSTMLGGTNIKFFTITNHSLNDTTEMIKTKNGHLVNSINSPYNMGLNYPGDSLPNGVEYDSIRETLSIPVVIQSNDSVTGRSDIYHFNGRYFQYTNTQNK